MLVNAVVLRKYLVSATKMDIMSYFDKAANDFGSIVLLIGSAGCFATVIKSSGIGDALIEIMSGWNISLVLLAAIIAAIIRMGVGSAAGAMTTSVSIVWPMASAMGYSPVIIGLAVCSGALLPLIPNDTTFWFPQKYNGVGVGETWRTVCLGNLIAGVVALGITLILNMFVGILPGL